MDRLRVLILAPFERGREQGGAQRATAIAERLEERGVKVGWQKLARRDTGAAAKLTGALRGRPALSGLYRPLARVSAADWDVALIAHSYLVPSCAPGLGRIPAAVDFHNLEWRHLSDLRGLRPGRAGPLHAGYERIQIALMQRLERQLLARAPLSLLCSADELDWARAAAPRGRHLLVPNRLPAAAERAAAAIAAARAPEPGRLVYLGTLTFPPNVLALRRFLAGPWAAMRAALPALTLTVAGRASAADRAEFERHPGVRALGFVEDLAEILATATAVVMPVESTAGTSLRALFLSLCAVPVIASPQALRGFAFIEGRHASTVEDWVAATRALAGGELADPAAVARSREAALLAQREGGPWDHLHMALAAVAERAGTPAGDRH